MIYVAKAIMIQGTMSNAGKSLLAAGLCRIFHQDGYRVAPFKSQNMALNSFITSEGLEMGRAQVMQPEAAGIEPSVLMNPILLKPTNDIGSQVIVNGEVLGTMSARDYFKYKKKLVPDIMKAYNALAAENDIIVMRTGYPGVACLVPKKYEGCQTFTTLIVRLKEDNNSSYVCSYINSDFGIKFIDSEKVGVAQQNVGAKSLAKMPIKIPPIELQNQFAAFVAQVDKSKVAVQKALDETQTLFDSLMQEYFG